jgi:hypothetical protein
MDRYSIYINLPHEITYLGLVVFFVYFKLNAILLNVSDPLAPLENLLSAIFMGGIWDALSRAIGESQSFLKIKQESLVTSRERRSAGKVENGTIPSAGPDKKDQ